MSIESVLAQGRRAAESRMLSRAKVGRRGVDVIVGGMKVPSWPTVHADLPLRLKAAGTRRVVIGGVEFQDATAEAHFPHATTDLADGDVFEVTSGEWVGSFFRIIEAVKGDQQTARRVPVVEVARPEGWA